MFYMVSAIAKWDIVVNLFAYYQFSGKGQSSGSFIFRIRISKCGRSFTYPRNVEKLNTNSKSWEFILFLVSSKSFEKLSKQWLDIIFFLPIMCFHV